MSNAALVIPNTEVALAVRDLEPESAIALRSVFDEMFSQAEEWTARARLIRVTDESQKREMKLARESRLALREIRVKAEHARKRLKEDSTRRGKAIDGIANVLKALVEPIEAHLLEQETFAERAEATRRTALKSAREEALRALGADPSVFANLGETNEETWNLTLDNARAAHEAKLEAAKQAELVRVEAERIAAEKREAARVAAVKAEAERVERERALKEEAEKAKAETEAVAKASREEFARIDRERAEERAHAQKEALAEREKAAEATRALETERARIANAEADAEALARSQAEERAAAALAPDREKLAAFAAALRAIGIPTLTTPAGKAAAVLVAAQMQKMIAWVAKTGASL